MMLLTKENREALPSIGSQDMAGLEAVVYVKFFCPWNQWTWWATEFDPEKGLFFGLVRGVEEEIGYFTLEEMEAVQGPGGLRIERDRHFTPCTLRDIMEGKRP